MSYSFVGFLTDADRVTIKNALDLWPGSLLRGVTTPFSGSILARFNPDEDQNISALKLMAAAVGFKEQLPEFSREYPEHRFIYIDYDCFSGYVDEFEGSVYRNGELLFSSVLDENTPSVVWQEFQNMVETLKHINVQLDENMYFEPFARGYWKHKRNR